MAYTNIIGRADVTDAMVPEQEIPGILKSATEASVIMTKARRTAMSSKVQKQPVLATLPNAYWVNGDTGLKQTSKTTWDKITMTAEELAVIVPIPNALIDDANVPLWNEVKPLLGEAAGALIDEAAVFGVNKPTSWPTALVPAATAAGNVIAAGTGDDIGVDIAMLAEKIDKQGFAINGFATRPGISWTLRSLRDTTGRPLWADAMAGTGNPGLYGLDLVEVRNGSWNAAAAELLAVDWSKVVYGVRQDITYDLFSEGVISDDEGKVVLNLMQQDSKALRMVMRVGFQVAVPVSRITTGTRYPAGVLTPAVLTPAGA